MATDGLLVIDVDGPENPWLKDAPEQRLDLAAAPLSLTAHGGQQYFFRQPDGKTFRNTAGRIAPCVDTRANGGYVVVPPSLLEGDLAYRWQETRALETPAQLPVPPTWLIALLETAAVPAPIVTIPTGANAIPEGQRNGTLTRIAGSMRRIGMSKPEILAALMQANQDRCQPPLSPPEVERIAGSVSRYEPNQIATAMAEGHFEQLVQTELEPQGLQPITVRQLLLEYPELRPPVLHGMLREGETMNLVSAPKIGKSWLVTDLALAIATGRPWLGHQTVAGDVLIIDNELHPHTSAHRIPKVAQARGISLAEAGQRISITNMRGHLKDLFGLGPFFAQIPRGRYRLIILDAFYRFMPMGMDENDNGTMANLYNYVDSYADKLHTCFVMVHHLSKGSQAGKSVTDLGAGAGSQSRSVDAHVALRHHEEEGVVVMDAAVRSWAPFLPRCLRWAFPVFMPADDLDPAQLRAERPRKKASDEPEPAEVTPEDFVQRFVLDEPQSKTVIVEHAIAEGLTRREAERKLRIAEETNLIFRWTYAGNKQKLSKQMQSDNGESV